METYRSGVILLVKWGTLRMWWSNSLSCTQTLQVLQMRSGLGLLGGMDDEPSLSKCSISIKQDGGRRGTVLRGVLVRTGFTVSPFCKKWYYYERLLSKNITCLWQKILQHQFFELPWSTQCLSHCAVLMQKRNSQFWNADQTSIVKRKLL